MCAPSRKRTTEPPSIKRPGPDPRPFTSHTLLQTPVCCTAALPPRCLQDNTLGSGKAVLSDRDRLTDRVVNVQILIYQVGMRTARPLEMTATQAHCTAMCWGALHTGPKGLLVAPELHPLSSSSTATGIKTNQPGTANHAEASKVLFCPYGTILLTFTPGGVPKTGLRIPSCNASTRRSRLRAWQRTSSARFCPMPSK